MTRAQRQTELRAERPSPRPEAGFKPLALPAVAAAQALVRPQPRKTQAQDLAAFLRQDERFN